MVVDVKRFKTFDIQKLVKAPWNYKDDDEALVLKLIENLRKNGQIENLIVRELGDGLYEVVNGNHRYEALVRLGETSAIAYDLGAISVEEAMRVAIETNETKFNSNASKLASIFESLSKEFTLDELETTMPFSVNEMENFCNLNKFNASEYSGSGSLEDKASDNLVIKLTSRDFDRWKAIVETLNPICKDDARDTLLTLISIAESLSINEIEDILSKV